MLILHFCSIIFFRELQGLAAQKIKLLDEHCFSLESESIEPPFFQCLPTFETDAIDYRNRQFSNDSSSDNQKFDAALVTVKPL